MKNFVFTLLMFLPPMVEASIVLNIHTTPEFPIEMESIDVVVLGYTPLSNIFFQYAEIDIQNNDITLDLFFSRFGDIGATIVTSYEVPFSIGMLNAGTYNVTANAYENSLLNSSISESFVVTTAIPLPGGIFLYATAIVSLFSFIGKRPTRNK